MAANQKLIRALRKALRELADPSKAPLMQAYMKSAMPYLGIQAVPFRKATKGVLAAYPRSCCGVVPAIAKNGTP